MLQKRIISIDEFLIALNMSITNHIFEDHGTPVQKRWLFWVNKYDDKPNEYYFNNGKGNVYAFKRMKDYGEIWMKKQYKDDSNRPQWSLWNTWQVVD